MTSRCEDAPIQDRLLYDAAQILMTQSRHWSWLRLGTEVATLRGMRRAIITVPRRLAVVLPACGRMAPVSVGEAITAVALA
jgi:hypothetical protein